MEKTKHPSPILLRHRFDDFERFAAAVYGWDVDFRQLDCGKFEAEITQVITPAVMVTDALFNRRLDQKGGSPAGNWTFGLLEALSPSVVWRGQIMTNQMIAVFPPGSDIDASSPPGFHALTISVSVKSYEALEALHELDGAPKIKPLGKLYKADPVQLATIRDVARCAVSTVNADRRTGDESLLDLPNLVVDALTAAHSVKPRPAVKKRTRLVRTLTDYVDAHLKDIVSLADLCAVANVSPRTVQYVFRDHFGVSPKQYIQARRLNGVRNDLSKSTNCRGSISNVANKWGFWHMGQFAADYKKLFGELPSETIN